MTRLERAAPTFGDRLSAATAALPAPIAVVPPSPARRRPGRRATPGKVGG
jgi:hypothetical protein